MPGKRFFQKYGHHLSALLGYLGLTLILTYPLVEDFGRAIPGDGFDGWQNVWNIWWVKQSLLIEQVHPYFTRMVDYPAGVYLYFHTLNIFNGLTFLPVTLNAGSLIAYNVAVVFSFVIGGYGTYLLALYCLRRVSTRQPAGSLYHHLAAFVAGVVFAFSPYHMAHLLGHMQLISLEWLPFFALFTMRQVDQAIDAGRNSHATTQNRPGLLKAILPASLLATLFLLLVVSCDWYYAFYMVLFSGLYWLWVTIRRRTWLAPTLSLALTGLLFLLITAGLWIPMVRESLTSDYMVPPAGSTQRLSADLTAFFTPSTLHPWWGSWAAGWADRFTASTSERTVFAGYSVLLLAIAGLLTRRRLALFWGLSAAAFALLALGPVLHIGGQTQFAGLGPIPLPYWILNRLIPLLRISRSVSRFDVIVMLSLAVLAAIGTRWLLVRLAPPHGRPVTGWLVALLLVGVISVEFLAVPYPMSFPETRPFQADLAQETGDFAIMDIPMDWDRPANLLYQTVHGKPMVAGYTSRTNPQSPAWRTPVLQTFRYLGPDVNSQYPPEELASTVLNDLNVRYVIVHKMDLPPGDYRETTLGLVDRVFAGWPVIVDDEWLEVLQVPEPAYRLPYLTVGEGWGPRQWEENGPLREMTGPEATFNARLATPATVHLELDVAAGPRPETGLEISVAGQPVGSYSLTPGTTTIETMSLALESGQSLVVLRSQPPAGIALTGIRLLVDDSPN